MKIDDYKKIEEIISIHSTAVSVLGGSVWSQEDYQKKSMEFCKFTHSRRLAQFRLNVAFDIKIDNERSTEFIHRFDYKNVSPKHVKDSLEKTVHLLRVIPTILSAWASIRYEDSYSHFLIRSFNIGDLLK